MTGDQNFDDELIDVSGAHDPANPDLQRIFKEKLSDEGREIQDPCAPPPPKAAIFHQDDSDPYARSDKWEGQRDNLHETSLDPKYQYELPYKRRPPDQTWKWANHPVVVTIVCGIAIYALFFSPHQGPIFWLAVVAFIFISPYWIFQRSHHWRYYNMEWEPDAEPTGCFSPYSYWWWW